MATLDELDARLAELEARIGPAPLAVPPVMIGELTDVPAPGSPIASQWAQETTNRIVHRFATKAALDAGWPAATAGNRALAATADGRIHQSNGTLWLPVAGSMPRVLLQTTSPNVANATLTTMIWQTEVYDTDNIHGAGATSIIIPAGLPGRWRFEYTFTFAANAVGGRAAWLQLNGNAAVRYAYNDVAAAAGGGNNAMTASATLNLAVGDVMDLIAYQSSGGVLGLGLPNTFYGASYIGPT